MNATARAINCSHCGATLTLHGGHRVRSLTCSYCGAVMDSHDQFKVIDRYGESKCMQTPLAIGMQATLKGVEFTLIGATEYTSEGIYRWVSFQLYSPTHGYTWLTYNKGHYVFSYRTRKLPSPVSAENLYQPKTEVKVAGRKMKFYERFQAKITYVAGELTWIARLGDKVEAAEAIAPPYVFSYEQSANELEYSIGEYIDADTVHQAFALEGSVSAPIDIHPAQPFQTHPLWPALAKAALVFAVIALLGLVATFTLGQGRLLVQQSFSDPAGLEQGVPFSVDAPGDLLKLELSSSVDNAWAYYDIALSVDDDAEGQEVLYMGKELSYYSGYDSEGSWTEGSQSGSLLFKVPQAGDYVLEFETELADDNWPYLQVAVYEKVWPMRYFVTLLIITAAIAAFYSFKRWSFEARRWHPVVGDDDEDDDD